MNPTVLIRPMRADDLDQVFKVRTSTIENAISMEKLATYGITHTSMQELLKTDVRGWVGETAGQIIGFCMGHKKTAEMMVLAVLPHHEGQGIASRLMHEVQNWLFALGHQKLWLLTTNNPSLRAFGFYQHLGWQNTGEMIDGEVKFTLSLHHQKE